MKATKFMAAALAAAALLSACNSPKKVEGIQAELPSQAVTDSVSYLIGVNFGYFVKSNGFGTGLNYSEMKKGLLDFINSKGNVTDIDFNEQFKINPDLMNRLLSDYVAKIGVYEAEVTAKESSDFLAANKMKDGVVETESGLQYKIIEAGNDVKPGPKDTVYVQYKGTLINGEEFDASNPSADPIQLVLDRVIPGWTEGLQLIGEGGKMQLVIPSDLAYGPRATGSIPANSTLIFDLELVKVAKAVETSEEAPVLE